MIVVITNEARTTVNKINLLVVSFDAYAAVLLEHFWPWEKPSLLLIDEQCENTEILFSMCQQTQPRWSGYGRAHAQRSRESVHLFEAQIPELLFRMARNFTLNHCWNRQHLAARFPPPPTLADVFKTHFYLLYYKSAWFWVISARHARPSGLWHRGQAKQTAVTSLFSHCQRGNACE